MYPNTLRSILHLLFKIWKSFRKNFFYLHHFFVSNVFFFFFNQGHSGESERNVFQKIMQGSAVLAPSSIFVHIKMMQEELTACPVITGLTGY